MGNLNLRLHYQCCIEDSNFNQVEDIDSDKEVEKEPFKLIDKTLERAESIITDISPSRRSSKNKIDFLMK
jgi:hypothetical protein